jgi:nuclear transport factor 2 (NTF2) superfamily protein
MIRKGEQLPAPRHLFDFGRRYTAAWCSQNPASVAAFYATNGSLAINGGIPAVGREAISAAARSFMEAFPDLQVMMDDLLVRDNLAVFQWTLAGSNTGPGGSGRHVRISGFEEWSFDEDGLIAESRGHFDSDDYRRQLSQGTPETR